MPYQWPVLVRTTYRNTYDGKDIDLEQPTAWSIWLEFIDVYSTCPGDERWIERFGTGRRFEYIPLLDIDMLCYDVGHLVNHKRLREIK